MLLVAEEPHSCSVGPKLGAGPLSAQTSAEVYTQHKSHVSSVVSSLMKGQLKEATSLVRLHAAINPNPDPSTDLHPHMHRHR